MRRLFGKFVLACAGAALCFCLAYAQDSDSPSLGDAARQARLQKQQKAAQVQGAQNAQPPDAKDAQGKDAQSKDTQTKDAQSKDQPANSAQASKPAKKVITNEDIPEHVGPTSTLPTGPGRIADNQPSYGDGKAPAEFWRSRIQAMKAANASLQSQIDSLNDSIRYAPGNCVSGCVQWNERQEQKKQQVEAMRAQLEQQQKQLEQMQEMARQQGYGSSVYDP